MAIYQLGDDTPDIAESAWVADSAEVMGQVKLGDNASVWFNATLRGESMFGPGRRRAHHRLKVSLW